VEVIMDVERSFAAVPRANVLPGPSRTITVEPVKLPATAPSAPPEPARELPPEPDRERRPDREPVPAP
jgi:hypothetical protein